MRAMTSALVNAIIATAYNLHVQKGEVMTPAKAATLSTDERIELCGLLATRGGSLLYSRLEALGAQVFVSCEASTEIAKPRHAELPCQPTSIVQELIGLAQSLFGRADIGGIVGLTKDRVWFQVFRDATPFSLPITEAERLSLNRFM